MRFEFSIRSSKIFFYGLQFFADIQTATNQIRTHFGPAQTIRGPKTFNSERFRRPFFLNFRNRKKRSFPNSRETRERNKNENNPTQSLHVLGEYRHFLPTLLTI